tara:strand:- start:883 stop:1293 length:411 start_codon:yes stop_codon:yes gene_type:complete
MKRLSVLSLALCFGFILVFTSCEKKAITPLTVVSNDGMQIRMAMQDDGYTEVIVYPIVKIECYFSEWDKTVITPVSGLFEYYDSSNDWVASIDFGDGSCDQWATKTWNVSLFSDYPSGSEDFSVFDIKGAKNKNPK